MKLVLAAMLLAACHSTDRVEPARAAEVTVVPRIHQIPAGHANDVRKLFDAHVLSYPITVAGAAGTNTQFIRPDPSFIGTDRFVIGATPEIHAALDTLLESLAKSPVPQASGTYTMTYWAIEAEPSNDVQVPADLAEIEPVLKSLGALGARKFHTIDRVSTRVLDGTRADVKSRAMTVSQTLSVDGPALELQLELGVKELGGDIETKLQLAPDKPVVLGETAMGSAADPAANLVLYVVRAQRAE
ncbi:MAG TPA: hypothetical protein VGG28_18535 [Kofleriaceae bacterium]|jgi:hypothetical protein